MTPEELGARGRLLGNQIDTVHLWSIANIYLVGRTVLAGGGHARLRSRRRRASRSCSTSGSGPPAAFRATTARSRPRTRAASVTPYTDYVDEFVAGCAPVRDDEQRARLSRLNALLTSYLFLLYFDTRAGLPGHRSVPCSPTAACCCCARSTGSAVRTSRGATTVAARHAVLDVLAAFVLDGVDLPRHRLRHVGDRARGLPRPHVVAFGLFDVVERRAGADRRDRRARARRRGEGRAAPARTARSRAMDAAREDRRRRVRVLLVPAAVRRSWPASSSSTGPCRATASTCIRSSSCSSRRPEITSDAAIVLPADPVTRTRAPRRGVGLRVGDRRRHRRVRAARRCTAERVAWYWAYLAAARRRARSSCATTR